MPATVTAPIIGSASAIASRMPVGTPARWRAGMAWAGVMGNAVERAARRSSEHLFEEGGDVVPAAIQDRPDDLDADPLEIAAGALDLRDAGPVGLDHDQGGVEARAEDRRVAIDVR